MFGFESVGEFLFTGWISPLQIGGALGLWLVAGDLRDWAWRRWGPRCAAPGPWRLPECEPCCRWRGHDDDGWHADGNGYVWNDRLGRWGWQGPTDDLPEIGR